MSESISEMFGCERKSDNNTIIDNYDDFSCHISLPLTLVRPIICYCSAAVNQLSGEIFLEL